MRLPRRFAPRNHYFNKPFTLANEKTFLTILNFDILLTFVIFPFIWHLNFGVSNSPILLSTPLLGNK